MPTKPIKNEKITLPFSENDLYDLMNGEKFDWTFKTNKGKYIDLHIINEDRK